jgi:hypothetical protein
MGQMDSFSVIPVSKFNDNVPDHRSISTAELGKGINENEHSTMTHKESLTEWQNIIITDFKNRKA